MDGFEEETAILLQPPEVEEKVKALMFMTEGLLVKAEEQRAIITMIHTDMSHTSQVLLPQLLTNAQSLLRVFEMIDTLEAVVKKVASGVGSIEEKASVVHTHVKPSKIKSFFASLRAQPPEEELPDINFDSSYLDCQALMAELKLKPAGPDQAELMKVVRNEGEDDGDVI
eukprot:c2584_g1_i2.p1 GENE.c2584_g1_i2~~c2584_g1_i2.p1  ORF type:complete len:177 (+),score=41.46 c2584_g1_i2:24-533(+)